MPPPTTTDPAHIPAASAPPGFTSNLKHPVTKDTDSSIAIAIVGMIVSTGFLIIRIYTKTALAKLFGVDDVLLILAWCLSMMVQISIVYYMADQVIGAHIWDLSVVDFQRLARITAVDSVIYLVVMALCKFSILLFYLKLSREKWFTHAIYATMFLVVGYSFSLACSLLFACRPLMMVWDVTITEGHCINRGKIYLATAGLNAATDVIMLIMPMPMIRKLQVPFRQKLGLGIIFAIGSFTMVTSIVRLCLMPPLIEATDMSWQLTAPATWICIEGNLFIICGSLPIMRLFLKHVAPRLIGESSIHRSGSRPSRQRQNTVGSSELSNLEKSKRNYAKMTDTAIIMETANGNDEGSETGIIGPSSKSGVTASTIEVEQREYANRHYSSPPQDQPSAPTPYSQLNAGAEVFPTPPLDRREGGTKTM